MIGIVEVGRLLAPEDAIGVAGRALVKSQRIFSTKLVCDALHSAGPLIADIITCRFDNF
jgi:hypothetical protein